MKIVEYGDEFTRRSLGTRREQTVAVLSQAELPSMGAILDQFSSKALVIMNLRLGFIAQGDAEGEGCHSFFHLLTATRFLTNSIACGRIVASVPRC